MSRGLIILVPLLFLGLFPGDGVLSEGVSLDYSRGCASARCDRAEDCLVRKFWCRKPPCPSMLYCSSTPGESLRGPKSCSSVRCSKGYVCAVKVRRCLWDRGCRQQIARCVSHKESYDGPASCVDFNCPYGHRCILSESLCPRPPCKLLKSCGRTEDVRNWHERCKTMGCPSEYECFLRRRPSSGDCGPSGDRCKFTPDCEVTNVKEVTANPDCRGWVCPRHQECSALIPESCGYGDDVESCKVNRTCRGPLVTTADATWRRKNTSEPAPIPTEIYHHRIDHYRGMRFYNPRNGPIYRSPIYVRRTVNRDGDEAGIPTSEERPGHNPITRWLDHLRLKTGVDAVNAWVKEAEGNGKYEEFSEWLEAVETRLGPPRFGIWLRELRKRTSEHPAFRKWLTTTNESVTSEGLPDQEEKPDPDYRTYLTEFYPGVRSGMENKFIAVNRDTPSIPMRKNAGHPRINYGWNRGYEQYLVFGPPGEKNEMLTWYGIDDDRSESREKSVSETSANRPVDHSMQFEFDEVNGRSGNESEHESLMDSVVMRRKNVSKDSRQQEVEGVNEESGNSRWNFFPGANEGGNLTKTYTLFVRVDEPASVDRDNDFPENETDLYFYGPEESEASFPERERVDPANPLNLIFRRRPAPPTSINSENVEKAFTEVILGGDERPAGLKNSKNSAPLSHSRRASSIERFLPKDVFAVSRSPEKFQSTKHTSVPNSPNDSITPDTDYRYECGDGNEAPPQAAEASEEKSSPLEETYEDEEREEYFEEYFRYRDEYPADLEANLTGYDFPYYDEEADAVAELAQLQDRRDVLYP